MSEEVSERFMGFLMLSCKVYLFKRGSRYYIQFHDQDGKQRQISTGCSLKTDAVAFLRDNESRYTVNHASKKISQFSIEFLSYGRSVYAYSTFRSYRNALKQLLLVTGDIRLSTITERMVDLYKSRRAQRVSPASVNIELRSLKSIFRLAKRWGYIGENPFESVPLLRMRQNEPRFLSGPEVTLLIDSIKEPWLKSVVQFAIFTGMRISEIVNLRWQQVYSERSIILVENNSHFQTKNKRNRIVPISQPVSVVLSELRKTIVSEYVFHNKGCKLCPTYTSKKFKQYVTNLGLNEDFVFHNLRSTFASWMIMSGVDIFIVSKLLGHSDVSVTSKHYTNVHNEHLFKSINHVMQAKMNSIISDTRQ